MQWAVEKFTHLVDKHRLEAWAPVKLWYMMYAYRDLFHKIPNLRVIGECQHHVVCTCRNCSDPDSMIDSLTMYSVNHLCSFSYMHIWIYFQQAAICVLAPVRGKAWSSWIGDIAFLRLVHLSRRDWLSQKGAWDFQFILVNFYCRIIAGER